MSHSPQVSGQASLIRISPHIPSQPKAADAEAQSNGDTKESSSAQSDGQASQVTGQASLIRVSPHIPSQPKAATAEAHPNGATAASSSTHSSAAEPILKKTGSITLPKISLITNS